MPTLELTSDSDTALTASSAGPDAFGIDVSGNGLGALVASANALAVLANATTGTAIAANTMNGAALQANSQTASGVAATSDSGIAITAVSNGSDAVSVHSGNGAGVDARSDNSYGVIATSYGSNALVAIGSGDEPAVYAIHGAQPTSPIGHFVGDVVIDGDLVLAGRKSAAVPLPDGTRRALYCVESPECWFEDFGRARLVRGRARVRLERTFAAVVRTGDYHVFLSPEGLSHGLYVHRRTRDGFEVREQHRGTSTVAFSYRIVARRKDIDAPRFKRIKFPARPKISLPRKRRLPVTAKAQKLPDRVAKWLDRRAARTRRPAGRRA